MEVLCEGLLGLLDSLGLVLGVYFRKAREFRNAAAGGGGGGCCRGGEVTSEDGEASFGKGHGKRLLRVEGIRALNWGKKKKIN